GAGIARQAGTGASHQRQTGLVLRLSRNRPRLGVLQQRRESVDQPAAEPGLVPVAALSAHRFVHGRWIGAELHSPKPVSAFPVRRASQCTPRARDSETYSRNETTPASSGVKNQEKTISTSAFPFRVFSPLAPPAPATPPMSAWFIEVG